MEYDGILLLIYHEGGNNYYSSGNISIIVMNDVNTNVSPGWINLIWCIRRCCVPQMFILPFIKGTSQIGEAHGFVAVGEARALEMKDGLFRHRISW